jgi:uncharacterized protein DUF5662
MLEEHLTQTLLHKARVASFLRLVIDDLVRRAATHDDSKLLDPERDAFSIITPQLSTTTYDSSAYHDALRQIRPALNHHYAVNAHHPEHWPNGINDMSLMDLIEMICDWLAASERGQDGNIQTSLVINQTRFGIAEPLFAILSRTAAQLTSSTMESDPTW